MTSTPGNVAEAHMTADILNDAEIAAIVAGIGEDELYTVHQSPNGRNGWAASDEVVSGALAQAVVRQIARGHSLTGDAYALTAAPDGTGGDLRWYRMVREVAEDAQQ